jgi:hypothetical protein
VNIKTMIFLLAFPCMLINPDEAAHGTRIIESIGVPLLSSRRLPPVVMGDHSVQQYPRAINHGGLQWFTHQCSVAPLLEWVFISGAV